jgi:hypothetical protein
MSQSGNMSMTECYVYMHDEWIDLYAVAIFIRSKRNVFPRYQLIKNREHSPLLTHAHISYSMSISKRLSQLDFEIHKIGH